MSGPGGKEVGRISIRVVPNTTGFRKKTQEEIDSEMSTPLEVPAEVDEKQLGKSVKKAVEGVSKGTKKPKVEVAPVVDKQEIDRFQRRMLAKLNTAFSKIEPTIALTADGEALRREYDQFEATIRKTAELKIPVSLEDAAELRAEVDRLVKRAEDIQLQAKTPENQARWKRDDAAHLAFTGKIHRMEKDRERQKEAFLRRLHEMEAAAAKTAVTADIANLKVRTDRLSQIAEDREKLQEQMDRLNLTFENNMAAHRKVDVELYPKVKITSFMVAKERIRMALDRAGEITLDTKEGNVKRFAAGMTALAAAGAVFAGGGIAKGISAVGSAITNAGAAALEKVGSFRAFGIGMLPILAIATLIPPALSILAGALVTLPALLTSILVPISAVALGMDGIKAAAEAAGLFSDKNGDKNGGGSLGASLDAIKEKVNAAFKNGLIPAFEQVKTIMASSGLQDAFANVATGLSAVFTGFTTSLSNNQSAVNRIVGNIGSTLRNMAPGIQDFTDAMIGLVDKVTAKFPGLGTAFSGMMNDFAGWVDKFTTVNPATGLSDLDVAMSNLRETGRQLWGLLGEIAGFSFDNLSKPGFAQGMKDFFGATKTFVTETLPSLQSSFETIADLANTISPVIKPLMAMVNGVSNGAGLIKDFVTADWEKLETGEQRLKSLDDLFTRLDASAAAGGSTIDQILAGAFGAGEAKVPTALAELPKQATAAGEQVAANLQKALQTGPSTAVTPESLGITNLNDLAALVGKDLAARDAGAKVGEQFNQGVAAAVQSGQGVAAPAAAGGAAGGLGALLGGGDIQTQVGQVTAQIDTAMTTLAATAKTQGAAVGDSLLAGLATISDKIPGALFNLPMVIGNALNPSKQAVTTAMQDMGTEITNAGPQLSAAASSAFAGFVNGITPQLQTAVSTVASFCQLMVSTALSFAGAMESAGLSVGASFAKGLASSTSLVADSASALLGAARAFFPNSPAKEGPFSGSGWVDKSGEAIGQGFADGIAASTPVATGQALTMIDALKTIFDQANGLGGNIVDTLKLDPAALGGKSQLDALRQQNAELGLEYQRLKVQMNETGDKTLKSKMKEIQAHKDQIGLQIKELDYAKKYGEQVDSTAANYNSAISSAVDLPKNFATTVGTQFMNDLGMSGSGMIPSLLSQGAQYFFQVANIDDALSAHQNVQNKQALQFTGR